MDITKLIQLKPEEEIIAVLQEDGLPHLPKLIFLCLNLVAPFFFLFPLIRYGAPGIVIFGLLLLFALIMLWKHMRMRAGTALILTDRRIIDFRQDGLFSREATEMPLTHIEEVSYKICGLSGACFNLGMVHIRMQGEAADIEFYRLRHPEHVQQLINDARKMVPDAERDKRTLALQEISRVADDEELEEIARTARSARQRKVIKSFLDDSHAR